jgi:hypothetical protein
VTEGTHMKISGAAAVAAALGTAVAAAVVTVPAAAEPPARPADRHCAVVVVGQKPSGELVTTEPACADSQSAAVAEATSAAAGSDSPTASSSTFTIGVHYDGFNWTGSSFSVVGDDCSNGWLNLNTSWINRVSSTLNGCPRIRHYDFWDLAGATEDTTGSGGNLTTLNNKTNSIQYKP